MFSSFFPGVFWSSSSLSPPSSTRLSRDLSFSEYENAFLLFLVSRRLSFACCFFSFCLGFSFCLSRALPVKLASLVSGSLHALHTSFCFLALCALNLFFSVLFSLLSPLSLFSSFSLPAISGARTTRDLQENPLSLWTVGMSPSCLFRLSGLSFVASSLPRDEGICGLCFECSHRSFLLFFFSPLGRTLGGRKETQEEKKTERDSEGSVVLRRCRSGWRKTVSRGPFYLTGLRR